MSHRAVIAAVAFAGTVVRITRRPFRSALRAAPAVAGAVAVALGLGEIAWQLWGRGIALGVAVAVAGVFLIRVGAEINAVPPAPRPADD